MACQAAASTGLSRCCHTVQRGAINHSKLGRELQALWGKVAGKHARSCGSSSSGSSSSSSSMGGMRRLQRGGAGRAAFATAAAADNPDYAAAAGSEASGPRVCILGGGFGGLYTAVKLESLLWPQGTKPKVTLIDQGERFVFKPLLYELLSGAASAEEVAPTYAQLLGPYPVAFVQGRVASVQPEHSTEDGGSAGGGVVVLSDGAQVAYDWLVVSLGAETSTFGIPGVKELALPFSTYQDAQRVVARLQALEAGGGFPEVVVVGGGYAGVELAATVAERLQGRGRIKLVTSTPEILDSSPQGQREAALRSLQDKGVSVLGSAQVTEVRRVAGGGGGGGDGDGGEADRDAGKRLVYLKDAAGQQEILEADLVLWSAGQAPVSKAGAGDESAAPSARRVALPFATNARGAMQTDSTLRALSHSRVFALGDISVTKLGGGGSGLVEQPALPTTAQVAFQQADYVAWNLWSAINGKPLLNFSYQHLGDMMSLGSTSGAVTMPFPVPPPLSAAAQAGGPLGSLLKLAGVSLVGSYGGGEEGGVTLEGPLAAAVRRAAYLYRQPTLEQQLRVAGGWAQSASRQLSEVLAAAGGATGRGGSGSGGSSP